MEVSIIIVTYNTLQMTKECIDSVFQFTQGVSFEVVLVDNASSDGSKEFFEKDNRIKYIYSGENLGFGRANNIGYEHSEGRYVFLLNSDTLLLNNAVLEFYNYMEQADKKIACCGCQLVDKSGEPIHSAGVFPDVPQFWRRIMHFTFYEFYKNRGYHEEPYVAESNVDYITGADLFIRREVIEKQGLFDPDFFMYFEETEMQFRYAKAGYLRKVITTPRIVHLAGGSNSKKSHSLAGVIREMKSRYIYCGKVMPPSRAKFIAWLHLCMIPRIAVCRAPKEEKKELIKLIIKHI